MKIAFTPVVYEHAARFVGRTPWEVSRDEALFCEAHRRAYLHYRQQVIAVGIDLYNLEAEAYGAVVRPGAGNAIPAIHQPLWRSLEEGLAQAPFDPATAGRVGLVLRVGRRLANEFPSADVRIPVAGPFSLAFNLLGIGQLCQDVMERPEAVGKLLLRLAAQQEALCRAVVKSGLALAFFESAAAPPMLSPSQFHELELPALRLALELAAECGGQPVPCILGGNTFPVLRDLLSTGTQYLICNVETDQAAFVAHASAVEPAPVVRINLDPGDVASHDWPRLAAGIDRALALAGGRPNCVLGTGALPFETPLDNMAKIAEYVA